MNDFKFRVTKYNFSGSTYDMWVSLVVGQELTFKQCCRLMHVWQPSEGKWFGQIIIIITNSELKKYVF